MRLFGVPFGAAGSFGGGKNSDANAPICALFCDIAATALVFKLGGADGGAEPLLFPLTLLPGGGGFGV